MSVTNRTDFLDKKNIGDEKYMLFCVNKKGLGQNHIKIQKKKVCRKTIKIYILHKR